MEIRNLITFVRVAELNSFTKAAEVLDYSQSTVSFQIKQLENELGCLLFERINHSITITERGKELLEYAKEICRLSDEFTERQMAPRAPKGFIHVVTPDSICEDMMLANYADFHKSYPDISLKFTTADTATMFHMLDHNEADLMLTLDSHVYHSDYIIAKEEHVDMHFVTGSSSPYATAQPLSLSQIANYPFLLTERGMGYRRAFDMAMARASLEVLPALELGRTDIITNVLEHGIGVSFLPDFVTQKRVQAGTLTYLNVTDVQVDIWKQLIYHKNKWVSRALHTLINYIKAHEFET
ncbi:MAG: LysR family transcriptional regulator [Clostridia bacterium]|nr:LysR family transcriptional regulator [Clostridia bacterium]